MALPRFLQPGAYALFVAEREGPPFHYQRIGAAAMPADANVVFTYCQR